MPPHTLSNFEIQKYQQKGIRCNEVYSRNNLLKTKDGAYVINLNKNKSLKTPRIALYKDGDNVVFFDLWSIAYSKRN